MLLLLLLLVMVAVRVTIIIIIIIMATIAIPAMSFCSRRCHSWQCSGMVPGRCGGGSVGTGICCCGCCWSGSCWENPGVQLCHAMLLLIVEILEISNHGLLFPLFFSLESNLTLVNIIIIVATTNRKIYIRVTWSTTIYSMICGIGFFGYCHFWHGDICRCGWKTSRNVPRLFPRRCNMMSTRFQMAVVGGGRW